MRPLGSARRNTQRGRTGHSSDLGCPQRKVERRPRRERAGHVHGRQFDLLLSRGPVGFVARVALVGDRLARLPARACRPAPGLARRPASRPRGPPRSLERFAPSYPPRPPPSGAVERPAVEDRANDSSGRPLVEESENAAARPPVHPQRPRRTAGARSPSRKFLPIPNARPLRSFDIRPGATCSRSSIRTLGRAGGGTGTNRVRPTGSDVRGNGGVSDRSKGHHAH